MLNQLYGIWQAQSDPLFDEHDYMEMAYRLALTRPLEWQDILSRERQLLKTDEAREEFDFVSRACNPDQKVRQELASSLKKSQHEAWAKHALELLNTK